MNIIKSKIFWDASHATNFRHLECVKTKKWIKILIYSPLLLKCLVKPIYVRGVSCVKPSDVQPHYFISLEREHVPGNLPDRNQKHNPHLEMLPDKSPALCPPGLEHFPISLLSAGCGERTLTSLYLRCSQIKSSANFCLCVPSVEASRRCRTISQSKQVICLAAQQKDNVAEHMCTRSRAPVPLMLSQSRFSRGQQAWNGKGPSLCKLAALSNACLGLNLGNLVRMSLLQNCRMNLFNRCRPSQFIFISLGGCCSWKGSKWIHFLCMMTFQFSTTEWSFAACKEVWQAEE